MEWLRALLPIKRYALFAAVVYVLFVWAGLSGIRLLGDDNEAEPGGSGSGRTHGSSGRASYFHK
ncbi:hypothetical protein [Hymenobacter sp. 102]|uniref:hypothetical protein n=1 Tax=Hymenobacter sp. 102 TaxID=3403152 RepID=UPI003CF6FF16